MKSKFSPDKFKPSTLTKRHCLVKPRATFTIVKAGAAWLAFLTIVGLLVLFSVTVQAITERYPPPIPPVYSTRSILLLETPTRDSRVSILRIELAKIMRRVNTLHGEYQSADFETRTAIESEMLRNNADIDAIKREIWNMSHVTKHRKGKA